MRLARVALVSSVVVVMSLAAQAFQAAPDAPWLGTWKLNIEKSKYNPGPGPAAGTVSIFKMVPLDGGRFKYTIDGTSPDGRKTHAELTGAFDGKNHVEIGNPGADTNRFRILGERSYEVVDTKDGIDTMTIVITISPDGKTRTSESKGRNLRGQQVHNITVWDRQ